MTGLALRNPIAILMLCIGLTVFAAVVTPRMPVDPFPELTPPVLIIGTLAPGLAARDVEKTISWRLEKYVSATPGVDQRREPLAQQLQCHLRLAEVGHGSERSADPRSVPSRLRHGRGAQVARRPAPLRVAV